MPSEPQPVGTPVDPRARKTKRHGIEPSGPRGDNPATAGPGSTSVRSNTPATAEGHLAPSPEDTNTTPGSTGQN